MPTTVHPGPRRQRAVAIAALGAACLLVAACAATPPAVRPGGSAAGMDYPASPRSEQVDDYHGTLVADPYRWTEQFDSPAVKEWVAAQNRLAQPYLEGIPAREPIRQRLARMWSYERFGIPVKEGGRYFWLRNDGTQDQSVLYFADRLDGEPRVLIDPNTFAKDATIALADWVVSPDGRLVAYATSDGGTDWKTWRVREVATGKDLPDVIRYTKFTRVSWDRDAGGFFYARYPQGASGEGDDQKQVRVYQHRLGEPQASDAHVYSISDHPTRNPEAYVTDDGHFLVISVFDGYDSNGLYYLDLTRSDAKVIRLLDRWDALYTFLGNRGREFLVRTTNGAPRGRVVAIDLDRPDPGAWRTVVPEQPETLDGASYVGAHVVAHYLRDARALARVYRPDGTLRGEIAVPGAGTARGFDGHGDDAETFFSYTDYLTPESTYRYDVATDQVSLFRRPRVAFDPGQYVTEQVFYPSRDGTRVPMFITRRRDAKLDGASPTLLYGYGGFNAAMTPVFSVWSATWLDLGGIYAVANIRGGEEYGKAWHEAGTKLRKQNVFDDFIAAADWLVAQRYTSRGKLAIMGRSNGGLLVGAVITQRPDIAAAALPGVGVLDMLRYHTASANARQWSSDYGLSEDPEQFRALLRYSPVHNVREGTCYPPTLITTADHDDRVVPWHSYKFGAALQHAQGCANPVLLRIETRAGHGAGKPVWMQIEDWADQWAFLAKHLGVAVGQ